jgi:hypothetical protein
LNYYMTWRHSSHLRSEHHHLQNRLMRSFSLSHCTPLQASIQYLFTFGAQLFAFPCPLSPSIAQKVLWRIGESTWCITGFHERLCILLSLHLDWWRMIRESSIHCIGYCVTCFGAQYLWVFEQSTIQVFAPDPHSSIALQFASTLAKLSG